MNIKLLLHTIKIDFQDIFRYPSVQRGEDRPNYDVYWQARRSPDTGAGPHLSAWQRARASIIAEQIETGASVLDLGCGDGAILQYLTTKKKITGIGADISETVLSIAREAGMTVMTKDIFSLDAIDTLPRVDYVLGLEVIEHMSQPEEWIQRVQRIASKGLIFSIPNTGYYMHRLRLLCGRFPLQWVTHPGEHLRFWTVSDFRWWSRAFGYDIAWVRLYQGLPLLNKLAPSLFAKGIIFCIKP